MTTASVTLSSAVSTASKGTGPWPRDPKQLAVRYQATVLVAAINERL
ncbi:hypothetical protein [Streptomyces inhibens]